MAFTMILLVELCAAYWLLAIFIRYWKLRHIPGPLMASVTDFWRAKKQRSSRSRGWLHELHKEYGPLVRIAPNTVSVGDASSVKTIFTTKGDFKKGDSYGGMRYYVNGKVLGSLIDIQDEERFKDIKRAIGAAFATRNLLDYELDVDQTIEALKRRLAGQPTGPLYPTLQLFQVDFLMKITFSEPGERSLEEGKDIYQIAKSSAKRGIHWVQWQPLPWLERFIFHSPIWARFIRRDLSWLQFANGMVERRRAESGDETKTDLLQRFLDASEKQPDTVPPDTVASLVYSILSAGRDTTISALAAMIMHLLRNPDKHKRLVAELDQVAATRKLSSPPKYAEINTLPYLDAFFKEILRVNPIPPIVMERVVPPQGTVLAGAFIPGGTVVGCLASIVHSDQSYFGTDAEEFRPERWLTENKEEKLHLEKGFIGFGGGSRICIGRHIAELEVKKVISALLMDFDVSYRLLTDF